MIYFQWHVSAFGDVFLVRNWTYIIIGLVLIRVVVLVICISSGQRNEILLSKRLITKHLQSFKCLSSCVGRHFRISLIGWSKQKPMTYLISLPKFRAAQIAVKENFFDRGIILCFKHHHKGMNGFNNKLLANNKKAAPRLFVYVPTQYFRAWLTFFWRFSLLHGFTIHIHLHRVIFS